MWPLLLCSAWHILKGRQQLPEVQLAIYKDQCLKYGVSVPIIDHISALGEHAPPPDALHQKAAPILVSL